MRSLEFETVYDRVCEMYGVQPINQGKLEQRLKIHAVTPILPEHLAIIDEYFEEIGMPIR
jgi:hypothetical protein